ncbi:MAG: sulfotransferase [Steroidobacteraceae bacterium]
MASAALHELIDHTPNGDLVRERASRSAPILLVGLPRSGTTWVGKIFDSHPSTLYLHEPDSAIPITEMPLIAAQLAAEIDPVQLRAVLARTMSIRLTRVAGSLPRFKKAYRGPALDWIHRRLAFGAKVCSRFLGEFNLPDLVRKSPEYPVRVVWKSIESVGRIGLIARLLPQLRIIHILRHPCGWMASQTRGHHHHQFQFPTDRQDWWRFDLLAATDPAQRRGLSAASFDAMSDLERDVWSWILWNENGAEPSELLPNVMTLLYEEICAAPLEQSRRMFDFALLDWNAQTDSFIRRSVSVHRDDYYSVFRDPSIAANRWRGNVSAEDLHVAKSIMRQSKLGKMFLSSD